LLQSYGAIHPNGKKWIHFLHAIDVRSIEIPHIYLIEYQIIKL